MPSELSKITHPFIYEINTWPWLAAISKDQGAAIDLGSVPDRYWDEIADLGFDGVWLMGVWQRSDEYQHRLVRFVENHDEPRAVSAFGSARSQVAAVTALTQCGARLIHNGQLQGATVHLPVFLGRYPVEPTDSALLEFYRSFLPALADSTFRHGRWRLCDRSGWPGDDGCRNLITWCWEGDTRWLIIVKSQRWHSRRPRAHAMGRPARSHMAAQRPHARHDLRPRRRRPGRRALRRARCVAVASVACRSDH